MALATAFVIARFWIRAIKHRFFVGEEIPIHIAWACMMAVCINFIVLTPTLYKIAAVLRDERPADADYVKDVELSLRIFFVNFPLFWSSLWCVKIAMLVQCKRLVERQRTHTIFWWCILAFTGASYLACILNQLTPCKSLRASLNYRSSSIAHLLPDMALLTYIKLGANPGLINDAQKSPCTLRTVWMYSLTS